MEERWKIIEGTDGKYSVSDWGNVKRNKPYFKSKESLLLKKAISTSGYYQVNLGLNGKRKIADVGRLVAKAFVPNPENYQLVLHKNSDKLNNDWYNLVWAAHKDRFKYAQKNGYIPRNSKRIRQVCLCGKQIREFNSLSEAARETGVSMSSMSMGTSLKNKGRCAGYYWEYIDKPRDKYVTKKSKKERS